MPGIRKSAINVSVLYFQIVSKLSTHRTVTSTEIQASLKADGIQVELRTLQRALKALTESNLPIVCDTRSNVFGYRLRQNASGFRIGAMSPAEMLLLQLAKRQMQYQMPPLLLDSMEGLFHESQYRFATEASPEGEWLNKVSVVSTTQPLLPPKMEQNVFDVVCEALYNNECLDVVYVNKEKATKTKTVRPIALVQQGVRLYLVCQFEGYDDYRHLALHRIRSAKNTGERFERPADFNLNAYIREGRFGYGDGKIVRLKMRVAASLAADLAETPLSEKQTITHIGHAWWVEADVTDSEMLDWWIRSYGRKISLVTKTPIVEATAETEADTVAVETPEDKVEAV